MSAFDFTMVSIYLIFKKKPQLLTYKNRDKSHQIMSEHQDKNVQERKSV